MEQTFFNLLIAAGCLVVIVLACIIYIVFKVFCFEDEAEILQCSESAQKGDDE